MQAKSSTRSPNHPHPPKAQKNLGATKRSNQDGTILMETQDTASGTRKAQNSCIAAAGMQIPRIKRVKLFSLQMHECLNIGMGGSILVSHAGGAP